MRRFLLLLAPLVLLALVAFVLLRGGVRESAIDPPQTLPAASATSEPRAVLESEAGRSTGAKEAITATQQAQDPVAQGKAAGKSPRYDRIRGVVRFADSKEPVEGAIVMIHYVSRFAPGATRSRQLDGKPNPRETESTVPTRSDGEYSLALLSGSLLDAAEVRLQLRRIVDGMWVGTTMLESRKDLQLHELDGDLSLDLYVRPAQTLLGHVMDRETRGPIQGAFVSVVSRNDRSGAPADSTGEFRIPGVAVESGSEDALRFTLLAQHPDYINEVCAVAVTDPDRQLQPVTIYMTRGLTVAGIVLEGGQRPVPNVRVRLLSVQSSLEDGIQELAEVQDATSSSDGRFYFTGIKPFDKAWLVVRPQQRDPIVWYGDARVLIDGATAAKQESRIDIELQASVEVQARYPDGVTAERSHLVMSRGDSDGPPTFTSSSVWLPCPVNHPVRIIVCGKKQPYLAGAEVFRGEAVATFALDEHSPAHVSVDLATAGRPSKPRREQESESTSDVGVWSGARLDLRFRDAETGRLLVDRGTVYVRVLGDGAPTGQSAEGASTLFLPLGWSVVEIDAVNYLTAWYEFHVTDQRPKSMTVGLKPVH